MHQPTAAQLRSKLKKKALQVQVMTARRRKLWALMIKKEICKVCMEYFYCSMYRMCGILTLFGTDTSKFYISMYNSFQPVIHENSFCKKVRD